MARRKTSTEKGLAALTKLAGGAELDLGALFNLSKKSEERGASPVDMEATAVLRALHHYHQFMTKKCKECGAEYVTNYCANNYCSDLCISEAMRKIGIKYDPFTNKRWEHVVSVKDNLRYSYEPPLVISTQTLNQLEDFARSFLADLDRLRDVALNQALESLQTSEEPGPETEVPESLPAQDNEPLTSPPTVLPTVDFDTDFFA